MPGEHHLRAVAFPENFVLKDLLRVYPDARIVGTREMHRIVDGGAVSYYPFGAVTFRDVPLEAQAAEVRHLREKTPRLSEPAVEEQFLVREGHPDRPHVEDGTLAIDELTEPRAEVIALVVAQSAAMEYYERIVDGLFAETDRLVDRLERSGTVTIRVRRLHRFIGQALGARGEVLSVLHLLDKPDATWDDPAMDRIYDELRAEFDLLDRYHSLEAKLRGIQEAMEMVLDVARDRRLFTIEVAVVLLIALEIVLSLIRH